MAFKPLQFLGGTLWGAVTAPFKWVGGILGGAFSGGIWGGLAGTALAVVGPYALPYIQGMIPGLESVGWLTEASKYLTSHSFVERLAFLGLGGAGIGAASGAALGTVTTISQTLGEEPVYITNPDTKEQERVVAYDDGQKLGLAAGTIAVAGVAAVLGAGAYRKYISGGEEVEAPKAPTVKDASVVEPGGVTK